MTFRPVASFGEFSSAVIPAIGFVRCNSTAIISAVGSSGAKSCAVILAIGFVRYISHCAEQPGFVMHFPTAF